MELLTEQEKDAVDLAGKLATALSRIIPERGFNRADDLNELLAHIHIIQRSVMANAAARAYPGQFRQLGLSVREDAFCRSAACPDYKPGDVHQAFTGACRG